MERIGMTHDPADDFDHPNMPPPLWRLLISCRRRSPRHGWPAPCSTA